MRPVAAAVLLAFIACTGSAEGNRASSVIDSTTLPVDEGWVEIAPMRIARSEHPAVIFDGEIVVVGGFIEVGVGRVGVTDAVEAYDPVTDTWRDLAPLPEPIHHGMAAVVSGRLFVIGGYSGAGDPSNSVWELVGDNWVEGPSLPDPVAAGSAVVVDNSIYVVGGTPDGGLNRYDVTASTWFQLVRPDTQREHVAAIEFDGDIWAIAGRWQGEILDTIEVFDVESETWRSGPSINEARSGFGAAVIDGSIVVAGGEVFAPDQALSSVERFDSETGDWLLIDPLPHGLHGNPLVAVGSDLYLPGGSIRAADVENDGRSYRLHLR